MKLKTPRQKFMALKDKFVSEFKNQDAWGIYQNSGHRLEAYNQLRDFIKESLELVENDEALTEVISYDISRLLIGRQIKLPYSLEKSMKRAFVQNPYEDFTQKLNDLRGELYFDANDLCFYLRNQSDWWDENEDEPFPYMRGIPSYIERCGQGDFVEIDHEADETDWFGDYLRENKLYSLCGYPVDSDSEDAKESEERSLENCSEGGSVMTKTPFESFQAKLRRFRWKIYQKIGTRTITNRDLNKYEILVNQFVKKFENTELSKREVRLWKKKVDKTRNDALVAPFDEHLFNEVNSDVSSHKLSSASHENDVMKLEKTEFKNDSVEEFFANQEALENLLDNLPSVPNSVDEELEERLKRLRSFEEPDDSKETEGDPVALLDKNVSVSKIQNPLKAKNNEILRESADKIPDVKDLKSEKIEVLVDRTDIKENKTTSSSSENDAFDAKQDFNTWYENALRTKKKKQASAPAFEDIFLKKADENSEYKQKSFSDPSDFQNKEVKSPELLIFVRACFILLITMCRTLNDQKEKLSSLSTKFPVTVLSSTQSPMFTPRPMPCSVTKYERTYSQSCHCEQSVPFLAIVTGLTSSAWAGVALWYSWTRAKLQHWKEKVIIKVLSVIHDCLINAEKSVNELKLRRVVKK